MATVREHPRITQGISRRPENVLLSITVPIVWAEMNGESSVRYYAAILASVISVLGWLGVAAFGGYAIYRSMVGGSVYWPSVGLLASFVVGAVFAKIEKALYGVE